MSFTVLDELDEFVSRKDDVGLEVTLDYLYVVNVEGKNCEENENCQVVSPPYKFHKCLHVINFVLSKTSSSDTKPPDDVIMKSLKVAKVLLDRLCPRLQHHRLDEDMAKTELQQKFQTFMVQVVGYTESEDIRRLGISVFKSYLWAFDAGGRFSVLQHIFHTVDHVGLVGYMVTQLKNFVVQALSKDCDNPFPNEPNPANMMSWFLGKNLQRILEPILKLPNEEKTDIIQYYDKIISSLNLLLFLFLRDGKENRSGFVNYITLIDEKLLKPLRVVLDITTMHYKLKIRELKDPPSTLSQKHEQKDYELFLDQVGGERIKSPDEYTPEEHMESYNNVLKQLDLMECVYGQ